MLLDYPCPRATFLDPGASTLAVLFGTASLLFAASLLPSAFTRASAFANHSFRGSITRPMGSLSNFAFDVAVVRRLFYKEQVVRAVYT